MQRVSTTIREKFTYMVHISHLFFPCSMKKLLVLLSFSLATMGAQAQAVQQKTTTTSTQSSAAGTTRTTARTHNVATPSGNYHSSTRTQTKTTPAPATKKTATRRTTATRRVSQ